MKKIILWTCGIVLAILVLTNPSMQDFKEYIDGTGSDRDRERKEHDFLIFSIYSARYVRFESNQTDNGKFLGVLKNFIDISERDTTVVIYDDAHPFH